MQSPFIGPSSDAQSKSASGKLNELHYLGFLVSITSSSFKFQREDFEQIAAQKTFKT
jgi:hypothetical protein